MFQGLSQGSTLSILYRNEPKVVEGRVVSVNTHMPAYNPSQPMAMLNGPVTDITVQIDNDTIPFVGLPAHGIVANFPDKGMFVSTDRTAIIKEVESMSLASKQILEQVPMHQKMIKDCDALLLTLQPERKKEAKQEQEIETLRRQMTEMSGKFDEMVKLLMGKPETSDKKD